MEQKKYPISELEYVNQILKKYEYWYFNIIDRSLFVSNSGFFAHFRGGFAEFGILQSHEKPVLKEIAIAKYPDDMDVSLADARKWLEKYEIIYLTANELNRELPEALEVIFPDDIKTAHPHFYVKESRRDLINIYVFICYRDTPKENSAKDIILKWRKQ